MLPNTIKQQQQQQQKQQEELKYDSSSDSSSLDASHIIDRCADSDISDMSQHSIKDLASEIERILEDDSSESEINSEPTSPVLVHKVSHIPVHKVSHIPLHKHSPIPVLKVSPIPVHKANEAAKMDDHTPTKIGNGSSKSISLANGTTESVVNIKKPMVNNGKNLLLNAHLLRKNVLRSSSRSTPAGSLLGTPSDSSSHLYYDSDEVAPRALADELEEVNIQRAAEEALKASQQDHTKEVSDWSSETETSSDEDDEGSSEQEASEDEIVLELSGGRRSVGNYESEEEKNDMPLQLLSALRPPNKHKSVSSDAERSSFIASPENLEKEEKFKSSQADIFQHLSDKANGLCKQNHDALFTSLSRPMHPIPNDRLTSTTASIVTQPQLADIPTSTSTFKDHNDSELGPAPQRESTRSESISMDSVVAKVQDKKSQHPRNIQQEKTNGQRTDRNSSIVQQNNVPQSGSKMSPYQSSRGPARLISKGMSHHPKGLQLGSRINPMLSERRFGMPLGHRSNIPSQHEQRQYQEGAPTNAKHHGDDFKKQGSNSLTSVTAKTIHPTGILSEGMVATPHVAHQSTPHSSSPGKSTETRDLFPSIASRIETFQKNVKSIDEDLSTQKASSHSQNHQIEHPPLEAKMDDAKRANKVSAMPVKPRNEVNLEDLAETESEISIVSTESERLKFVLVKDSSEEKKGMNLTTAGSAESKSKISGLTQKQEQELNLEDLAQSESDTSVVSTESESFPFPSILNTLPYPNTSRLVKRQPEQFYTPMQSEIPSKQLTEAGQPKKSILKKSLSTHSTASNTTITPQESKTSPNGSKRDLQDVTLKRKSESPLQDKTTKPKGSFIFTTGQESPLPQSNQLPRNNIVPPANTTQVSIDQLLETDNESTSTVSHGSQDLDQEEIDGPLLEFDECSNIPQILSVSFSGGKQHGEQYDSNQLLRDVLKKTESNLTTVTPNGSVASSPRMDDSSPRIDEDLHKLITVGDQLVSFREHPSTTLLGNTFPKKSNSTIVVQKIDQPSTPTHTHRAPVATASTSDELQSDKEQGQSSSHQQGLSTGTPSPLAEPSYQIVNQRQKLEHKVCL